MSNGELLPGAPNMCGRLRRCLVIPPEAVGWGPGAPWRELGYFHPPAPEAASREHRALSTLLEEAGVELVGPSAATPPAGVTPDAVYCHDASLAAPGGVVLMSMGKPARSPEPAWHGELYRSLGIPVRGAVRPPALAEGGDLVWLDERTLLAGEGYRTNAAGIVALGELLGPGVEVIPAPLPHGDGPDACLHLMSLISVLDRRTIVADPRFLAVATVALLVDRGFTLIPIVEEERKTMAANVLSLGDRRLIALAENPRTNERLRRAGFDVRAFHGGEICHNGSGGPTCLTRPLVRDVA